MAGLFISKELFEQLGKYKYSGKIFIKRYLKQFFAILFSNMTSIIFLLVDGWVVSLFVGEDALNSVNLLSPLTMFTGAMTLLLSTGANIVLSKMNGRGASEEKKNKLFRAIVLMTWVFTVGVAILQIPIAYLMISGYSVSAEIKSMMSLYAVGIIISESASVVSTLCTYIFTASGKVKVLLKLTILESILNLILDFVFVKFCNMGIFGAGLGTAITCVARAVISAMLVKKDVKTFSTKRIKCTDEIKEILSNGVPAMATQLLTFVTGYLMNVVMIASGNMEVVTVVSVCGIGKTVSSMLFLSFVQSGNSIIGILVGSENWEVAKKLQNSILTLSVATVGTLVMIIVIFPQILFSFYNINNYTNFQYISIRLYMLAFIPGAVVRTLENMCIYCEKKKVTVITNILKTILLIVLFIVLDRINHNLAFLCYAMSSLVSVVILSIVLKKALKEKMSTSAMQSKMIFCFKGSEANQVSEEIFKFLKNNGASGKETYKLALACEELGAYAASGENGERLHIFLSVQTFDKYVRVIYLDDSEPATLNKKFTNDSIIENYNLIENMASEFTYQNVSGFNNFIMKFDK